MPSPPARAAGWHVSDPPAASHGCLAVGNVLFEWKPRNPPIDRTEGREKGGDIVEAVDGSPLDVELTGNGEAAGRVAVTWKNVATRSEAILSGITPAGIASPGESDAMFWI